MNLIFESENIGFVRVGEIFLKDYLEMINDPDTARFIGIKGPVTEEQELVFIRDHLEKDDKIFSMIDKKTGDFIGNIEMSPVDDDAGELGIAITKSKQNSGFGQEAIRRFIGYCMTDLGLKRITLKVYPENFRAIHVYEKCGFREYERRDDDVFMEVKW